MSRLSPILLLLGGCYAMPEDLPPFEGVPIEAGQTCAPPRDAFVACVVDGDTFDVARCGEDGERIRLLGVNAPEVASESGPAECFANEARARLRDRLSGADVLLEFDEECEGEFGRTLAWVFLDDDDEDELVNVNVWMVQQGLARVFREFDVEDTRFYNQLDAAERSARDVGVGLWGACGAE